MAPRQLKKLQVGVVGIGRMGRRHALNILHLTPRADLLCACSPAQSDLDWAAEAIVPYGTKVCATFEEMIEVRGLEAVIIASATALHASQSRIAMERGIHVLCEKPVTFSLEEVIKRDCRTIASGPGTKIMVGFTRRFDDSYKDARQKIQAGLIGQPVVFRSHGVEEFDNSGFFINYARVSGGIFVDSTIHDIDLALSFFGEDIQPKKIWAAGVVVKYHEMKEFHDSDNAVGVVEFWGGKIAQFYNSRTGSSGYDNTTDIFGTEGKISINSNARKNRVEITGATGVRNETHGGWIDRYETAFVNEVNEFTAAILDKTELPIRLDSAVSSLKIALALQESLVSGHPIRFDQNGERMSSPSAVL
ncbi:NAD-binding Rossmann fold oxidoreductase family protein [Penicillium chermesinum]|uniref:NAD-binding Rossmann fold oxidoreductase family protein n=1 Tax=Penicillium chermesinum TaxID=63820 RepID=A0A9W9PJZ4_9EURO|nr:NAD-binding Rossmann fold oxidoreductase family protein [Penicillium chermesinum]KAJ5247361.1 NAD-binding Rossmann fold oxidoreductase family protein [Penicillium chermesinum]KAJ6145603.1 NAD-binding Rossmann fold oxidoreductase family protein [Penicillium chermesinum]